jgi:hypothetical protein
MTYTTADFVPTGSLPSRSQITLNARAIEAERKSTLRRLNLKLNAVQDLERKLGITERWTSNDEEYQKAWKYRNDREFIRAVETLEGLVVQRLFELSKANLKGTGMFQFIF